jgi:tetratricopeptide (TPR) repeat protein
MFVETDRTMKRSKAAEITFRDHSFEECVRLDPDLAATRAEYAKKSAKRRRQAAEWEYDSAFADRLFGGALASAGQDPHPFGEPRWPEGVLALAIDPLYAPALLTVGSYEYQLGREEEAMRMFLALAALPSTVPDLPIIIDKAGDFLLDEDDVERARELYTAAEKAFPAVAMYPVGLGYCLGKLGKLDEAIAKAQRADELEPDNSRHLNDLGWALFEAGRLEEAEATLTRAVALAPADYDLVRENLRFVRAQRAREKRRAAGPPKRQGPRAARRRKADPGDGKQPLLGL